MKSKKPYESVISEIKMKSGFELKYLTDFVGTEVIPKSISNDENHSYDKATTLGLYKLGVLNSITPRRFGGNDLPVSDLVTIACELGYGSAGVAATFIGNLLGYSAVVLYGKEHLKEKMAKDFNAGFRLWSLAMTEKGCGSDLEKIGTRAQKVPGGFRIYGEKNFITNATHSTDLSIFANVENEAGQLEGITCFYIPGNSEGLRRGETVRKMGWRESNTGHLHFEGVFVPHAHVLGEVGEGLKILTHCLNRSKTLLGAVAVGICYRALDLVAERLLNTERFNKALMDQAAIRHLLARLHTKVEAAWMLTARAAAVWDSGDYAIKEASMAKLFAGATAMEVTSQAAELFGARGYLSEYEVSRLMRDAKAIEIVEGPSLVQELLIAKQVLPRRKVTKKEADLYDLKIKKNHERAA